MDERHATLPPLGHDLYALLPGGKRRKILTAGEGPQLPACVGLAHGLLGVSMAATPVLTAEGGCSGAPRRVALKQQSFAVTRPGMLSSFSRVHDVPARALSMHVTIARAFPDLTASHSETAISAPDVVLAGIPFLQARAALLSIRAHWRRENDRQDVEDADLAQCHTVLNPRTLIRTVRMSVCRGTTANASEAVALEFIR